MSPTHKTGRTTARPTASRPPRADAQRSIAAILEASITCLRDDPGASLVDIAKAAGVGRVTVYSHFSSRGELIEAVLAETMTRSNGALDEVDLSGEPTQALTVLVRASWQIVEQFQAVLAAAQRELAPQVLHEAHAQVMERLHGVIDRGRDTGAFRVDVPGAWLVSVVVTLMHGAAEEVRAGRFDAGDAADYVVATVLSAVTSTESRSGTS